jgi:hypothetical protein
VIPVICTVVLPVFVRVSVSVDELPVFTFPKLRLVELKLRVSVAATPVPVRATVAGELGALLVIVKFPLALPVEVGVNCTLNVLACAGFKVSGSVNPLVLKPLPVTLTWETVNVAVPVLLSWMVWESVVPTATLPKGKLDGVMLNAACTPVPVTGMTALAPCVFETVTFPLTLSLVVGLKLTVIDAVCEGVKVTGVVMPETLTSFALTVTWEIVMLPFPVFMMLTLCEPELPACTFPKATLDGVGVIVTVAATPVPVKETVAGDPGAVLEMLIVPGSVPAVVGENCAVTLVLCPAATDAGVVNPLML